MGQAAGYLPQDGLADVEGEVCAYSRRIVTNWNGGCWCKVFTTRWGGPLGADVQAAANQ
ncbi:hypothetical protein MPNT_210003 [Candidatus Methylacidithermus pantelleriae]|uniref:Uncharacterized protein n=1 Tax=Candidatus Methylacidithermus pantelleriae TaxID=2744239 RepID=A0A8J2FW41_9BACT|nr:hypothetical protein MPNT_210003 [Candidatus Methylacidithermus pantelleriae]